MKATRVTLTPKWEENWSALTRLLELGEGFHLIFVFTDEPLAIDFLREQLVKQFTCAIIATPTSATEAVYHQVMRGLSTLIESPAPVALPQAIWIDLHRQHTVSEPLKVLLARLNERREWLRHGLKIPIIFVLTTQTDVGRFAPDFWSIRDLVLFLDNTIHIPEKKFIPNWLTTSLQSFVANPYVQFTALIATLLGGWAAFDYLTDVGRYAPDFVLFLDNTIHTGLTWLTTFLQSFVANPYIQFTALIATLLGGWSAFDYFRQKRKVEKQQAIVNNSLICRWFPSFCFLRAYLRHIIHDHRVFNIKGLRTRGTYTIELEQVFVDLRIAPSTAPNQSQRDLLAVKELQGNQPIWEFLRYGPNMVAGSLLLAIIGSPGCGKTTLLQHIALMFATGQRPRGLPKWVPILLLLRQHVKTILADSPLLAEVVQQHFANPKRYPDLVPPEKWFHRQLQAGQCLVLLDGLDEVANAEERKYISAWIDEQVVNYPRCPIIVTSRPGGYQVALLARATVVLEVQAFTPPQVREFIDKWYLATEIMSFGGKDDAGVRLQAKQEAEDLRHRLHTRPTLMALTVNPLLLTMIAMVHRYRGQLPGKRVELYAEICDVLLGHWREGKGIQDKLTAAQKRVALQPLAAWMMEHSVREIAATTAMEVIRAPLQTVGLAAADIESFFQDIQASSGLFSERETGVWSFAHLTFQEYLAAAHFKEQTLPNDGWSRKVADSWWHETLRLYAAQTDATPIVSACLHTQNIATLTLAADCLEEALKLNAPVRQQVEELLIANLESANPELFKLAAEVKLQQRLRNLRRLDDETTEIDIDFISCAEYQLFLDEMRAQEKFYQPDHWLDYRFVKGSAMQPVVGVRTEDAATFCEWLSGREKVKYRCPTLAEAQECMPVTDIHQLATWCRNGYDWDLHWGFPQAKQDIESTLGKLFEKSWVMRYTSWGTLDLDLALDLDLDLDRTLDLNLARALDRALALDLALALDPALAHARNLAHARALARALALALARALALEGSILQNALEKQDFIAARERLQELQPTTTVEQRKKVLLTELLTILTTDNYFEQQQAWRRYIAYLAEYTVIGYESLEQEELKQEEDRRTGWRRLFHWRKTGRFTRKKTYMAQLGLWSLITDARQAGQLPAWEGIRIVRDRGDEEGD